MPVEKVTDSDVSHYNTGYAISADQLFNEACHFFVTTTMWEHYSTGSAIGTGSIIPFCKSASRLSLISYFH